MTKEPDLLNIVQTALGTFDFRQSFSPGMFEPLKPLFVSLGYTAGAVYMTDDYPDRMHLSCAIDDDDIFPPYIALNTKESLYEELSWTHRSIPNLMVERLFSHGRELGVIAAVHEDHEDKAVREAFSVLAKSLSVMAYVEYIRTNSRRERQERDVFFAQSLSNRILMREPPTMHDLKLGYELIRSLEAGGDFFDFIPQPDGSLFGFIGCCNGQGLRTVMEVTGIMRAVHRAGCATKPLAETIGIVNEMLVRELHRAHQASLAVFRVDVARQTLSIAKAGRLGILLCGPGTRIENISAPGSVFLGMIDTSQVAEEKYEFKPGQALFAVTEGFYSSRNVLNARPQLHWFLESVSEILATKHKKPLANAIFDVVNRNNDHTVRPTSSMLALSIEFRRTRDSVRTKV